MNDKNSKNEGTRILIIRFSSIGDIVLTTPLLAAIKQKHPGLIIDYLTLSEYGPLLKYNPCIDELIELDRAGGLAGVIKKMLSLRERKYRYILDLHRSTRSMIFRLFLKSEKKFTLKKKYFKRFILLYAGINLYKPPFSVVNRYFYTAGELEVISEEPPGIWIDPQELRRITETVKKVMGRNMKAEKRGAGSIKIERGVILREGRPLVTLMPFAKWKTKEWGDENFMDLGRKISAELDADILVLGGREDERRAGGIALAIGEKAKSAAGKFSLLESAAALSVSDILVTNDTGVMHIGGAVSIPVISIFGSTTRELGFFPYRSNSAVIESGVSCRPCTAKGKERCPRKHFACMNDIRVDEVFGAVRRYF